MYGVFGDSLTAAACVCLCFSWGEPQGYFAMTCWRRQDVGGIGGRKVRMHEPYVGRGIRG